MLAFALEEGATLRNGTTPLDDGLELLPRDAILCHQSFGDAFQRLRMLPHKRFGLREGTVQNALAARLGCVSRLGSVASEIERPRPLLDLSHTQK